MAAGCTQQAVLDFLQQSGGRVRHTELLEHFRTVFPEEPEEKAVVRRTFKNHVDNVAFVKSESGVKYVCLKRRFRCSEEEQLSCGSEKVLRYPAAPGGSQATAPAHDAAQEPAQPREEQTPGSGYGNDSQVRVTSGFNTAAVSSDKTGETSRSQKFVCVVEEVDGEMGNRGSFHREKRESQKESQRERAGNEPAIPDIAVIEASPLPAEASVFTLPEPAQAGSTGPVDPASPGLSPRDRHAETESPSLEELGEAKHMDVVLRRRNSKGSQRRSVSRQPESNRENEGQLDTHSLSGSEGLSSPKGSRKHFIEVMMSSSPQVRRSMVLRSSVYLPNRTDSDSASLASSTLDEDRTSVTLDPLEHEWMMCASDGEWGSLYHLLAAEPSLVLRKDFVTGFTCLHWAAKQGKPELIALIINFAKQHNVPISVDVRSNTGYTPLHIAAMHSHMEVVKLLVGAYGADVEVRDYSGRKACQYLTDNVSVDIQDIIGAYEQSDSKDVDRRDGGRWRFSKVLQSNLKPLRLLSPNDCVDGEVRSGERVLRRRSSLSRLKPKLQRLRVRTSQIVHSTTFHDSEERDGAAKGSFKARPKTHWFG